MIISQQQRGLVAAGHSVMLWNHNPAQPYQVGQIEMIEGLNLTVTGTALVGLDGNRYQRVTVVLSEIQP